MIDLDLIIESVPQLLQGLKNSLLIACISSIIGLIGGTIIAMIEKSSESTDYMQYIIFVYVNVIRGTPMLIQILFAYYVLPQWGIHISPFATACIVIGINSTAYISQVIRSGIDAIAQGQWDAARSLGFTEWQIFRFIILPQAIGNVLPSLVNEVITLIKDSSLASVIGVAELTKEGRIIIGRTYDSITVFFALALFYICVTWTITYGIYRLERRTRRHVSH